MGLYFLRRLLLMIPTLFGITLVCFVIINLAPGSPIQQQLAAIRFGGAMSGASGGGDSGMGRGDQGVTEEIIEALNAQYGFDKPLVVRYGIWLKNIATLDFGDSFTYEEPVIDIILERIPVSLQFGVSSLLLSYAVCIVLGVIKALTDGSVFDITSSVVLFVMYSVPPLMLGILLIVFVAGFENSWFPTGGVISDNYEELSFWGQVEDRVRHFILPLGCYIIGSFTLLTVLMKNSMLDVIKLDYVLTAQAKGLSNKIVYMKHALRNALIPVVTGMGGVLSVFFAGSVIIEQLFQIDGMGLLGYNAALSRDYNVLMGLIFISSVLFLLGRLLVDFLYVIVDPRIDFS
ncbi:MAG: ABC transporter permease subunit [Candidatus Tectomicrobia bacterium]|nr:ABC transporter permease subunit [Candidatus Tectomicrobia bacterium]